MAKILTLILLLTIVCSISAQCTTAAANSYYKRSVYEFSINLMKRLSEEYEGHFVSSPLSTWSLISSIHFASRGKTWREMKEVLRLHPHNCFTNKYFETVINIFQSDAYTTTLEKSSTLFVDENTDLKQSFIDELTNIGIPGIEHRSFDNFETISSSINDYVNTGTAGRITEIGTPEEIESSYITFVDALYFKAPWKVSFSSSETETSAFYDASGVNQIGEISLMYVRSYFNVTYVTPIRSRVLELPYGGDSRFSMLIFLPDQGVTLANLIDSMKHITLRSVYSLYETQGAHQTDVQIPRFNITSDLANLKELLSDMGLASIFDPNGADLPNMSDYDLPLSSIVQKAAIEVTEEGSGPGVAESDATPQEFVANKPFLFIVLDKHTEVPVFVGAYTKPSI